MLSGSRMPSSSANFSAGMILPRAIPDGPTTCSARRLLTCSGPVSRRPLIALHPRGLGGGTGCPLVSVSHGSAVQRRRPCVHRVNSPLSEPPRAARGLDRDSRERDDAADGPGDEESADDPAPLSASSQRAAPTRTGTCQGCWKARPRGIADPAMAPITAGPAPVRNDCTETFVRIRSKRGPPTRTNTNDGANAMTAANRPPPTPAAA